jgi:hypothetical protein
MNSYQLILKVMGVVDKRDPHRPGLPLKDLLKFGDVQVGLFDPVDAPERNVMGFSLTGEHLWTIASAPPAHERLSVAWQRITRDDDGALIVTSSTGERYVVDLRTGDIRRQ